MKSINTDLITRKINYMQLVVSFLLVLLFVFVLNTSVRTTYNSAFSQSPKKYNAYCETTL